VTETSPANAFGHLLGALVGEDSPHEGGRQKMEKTYWPGANKNLPCREEVAAWRPKNWEETKHKHGMMDILKANNAITIDNLERALSWSSDEREAKQILEKLVQLREAEMLRHGVPVTVSKDSF